MSLATATGCESRWNDRARSPISSTAKMAQSPTQQGLHLLLERDASLELLGPLGEVVELLELGAALDPVHQGYLPSP